ncbi:MAG: DNA topoisomerase III [Chthoniobacterales bacterium]|nr:DNA topoisomerase III [Chthoniobacterales bacterium]
MSKTLVIAEKPSVAADLARALGGKVKAGKIEFFEVGDYLITSAVGHLVELSLPSSMTKGKKGIPWGLASLPILPQEFDLKPIVRSAERLTLVKKLLKRPEVTSVINACDAGREGELIFHNIIQLSHVDKPVERLWLQSMTPEAIREGFAHLRPSREMKPLADAALCRAESDWLVGINSTRALTALNSGGGGFQLTPVGRVQTPTLAILAEREEQIRNFQPKTYFEIHATFEVAAGQYEGRWFQPDFKKENEDGKPERLWKREEAEALVAKCQGQVGTIEEQKKATTQASPLLYDLTTLQREANSRFGLSAKRTLQLAQRLYEHHKVLTYPRTDSRYLPEDTLPSVRKALGQLEEPTLQKHAALLLEKGWLVKTGRVFNNKKVSDHHAIIPTGASTAKLDEMEAKLYQMVAQRLVAVFYPVARFDVTTRITTVAQEQFKSEGKILTDPGWLAVYGKKVVAEDEENDKALVPVATLHGKLEQATTIEVLLQESQTRPPARFTEATLLSAMESAGKLVEDEELRDAMSQRGLGTPATRAAIIEGLLLDAYLLRQGRELAVTSKGMALVHLLRHMGIAALTSPEMTGEWEFKLKAMEAGTIQRASFMKEIRDFTCEIIEKAKGFHDEAETSAFPDLEVVCPKCGHGPFKENIRFFQCRHCGLNLWKSLAGRPFERAEIGELLEKKKIGPLEGFRSRFGKAFAAMVLLDEEGKTKFSFGEQEGDASSQEALRNAEPVGLCPLCKTGTVRSGLNAYLCDRSLEKENHCSFRVGKIILQRELPAEQIAKLIGQGKTDLLAGFVSKKGRKFAAYLKLDGKKIAFEFEPRKEKVKTKKFTGMEAMEGMAERKGTEPKSTTIPRKAKKIKK